MFENFRHMDAAIDKKQVNMNKNAVAIFTPCPVNGKWSFAFVSRVLAGGRFPEI